MNIWYKFGNDKKQPTMAIMDGRNRIGHIGWGVSSNKSEGWAFGYGLDEGYRGHGIMAKALKATIEWSELETFQACIMSHNTASIRTAENAGFKCLGLRSTFREEKVLVFEYKKSDYKVLTQYTDKVA